MNQIAYASNSGCASRNRRDAHPVRLYAIMPKLSMPAQRLCWIFLLLAIMACESLGQSPANGGLRILEPFDYHGVTLDDGELKRQFDEVRCYYLRIPDDDLLKGFRLRAGLPAPGIDLGGWYTSDTGHIFGQLISGYSRMYAASGDVRCRDKVNGLLSEWAKCIEPDGYFYYSRKPNFHYTYDKMVGGLVDAYLYCGNKEALTYLSRITDWAIAHLDRGRKYMDLTTEWYTLSENLYRAYLITGDRKYRDFGRVWEYKEYWNLYANKIDIFPRQPLYNAEGLWYHAYSHVNTLSSAAAAYLVTGQPHYLDTLKNAYDFLQDSEVFATGGYGPEERLLPKEELIRALSVWPNSCETQCGSWAGFKLGKYLISFTGDARYGDWIERLCLNCIGATMPMSPDGRVLYHVSYNLYGYAKHNIGFGWSCCAGSRPMAVADYDDLIYFKGSDGLYVNLFTPSTVKWESGRTKISVTQRTGFPETTNTDFVIHLSRASRFGIHVRVPGWLASPMTATVNGKAVEVKINDRGWAVFQRRWRDGDDLCVMLPLKLWASRLDAKRDFPAAIMYGPVVLAERSTGKNPSNKIDFDHLEKSLVRDAFEPLTYRLTSDSSILFRPFYVFKENEPYFIYFDPNADNRTLPGGNVVLGKGPDIVCSGTWKNEGLYYVSTNAASKAVYQFDGTGIRWVGCKFDDAGLAEVKIDDSGPEVVSQYGPGRDLPFRWEKSGLAPGKHSVTLTVLGKKEADSKGIGINIGAFEVIRSPIEEN